MTSKSSSHPEGLRVARERIRHESEEKTGSLNLSGLGLEEFPEELFQLDHLRELVLGRSPMTRIRKNCISIIIDGDLGANCIIDGWDRISRFRHLESLVLQDVRFTDLSLVSNIHSLRSLILSGTEVSDLSPLSKLPFLQSLDFSETKVSDLAPLSTLDNLQSLLFRRSQIADLRPLSGLTSLKTISCGITQIDDLSPLLCLKNLHSLDCSSTRVSDLSPISGLTSIESLDCALTRVIELSPLAGLTNLQSLSCGETQVIDLSIIKELPNLHSLDCNWTRVSDLSPIASLTNLQLLNISHTQIGDLTPLSSLRNLQTLDCSWTSISDLSPLRNLPELHSLDCNDTKVNDLSSLSDVRNLVSLDCSNTQVRNLSMLPLSLTAIYANKLVLEEGTQDIANLPSLEEFFASESTIPGIPQEVLSKSEVDNCLPRLRAHLEDKKNGTALAHNIKVIVIGNGRVGKTQIARRLCGMEPETDPDSTHGIVIDSFEFATNDTSFPVAKVHLWDFGGQDIYHGTHTLFMRTNAVFLLVWTRDSESKTEHEYGGLVFQNHQIPYWLEHIGRQAGFDQPVLLLQNQCDTPQEERPRSLSDETYQRFSWIQQRHYSALNDRGREGFDHSLREAVNEIIRLRGKVYIGRGRAEVIARLDEMRRQDEGVPPDQRRFRTLELGAFRDLCAEVGGISSVEYFLEYLHDCGLVFYKSGMFQNQIILDQAWALQAIYTVLDRRGLYTALRQLNGRFTQGLLAISVWKDYSKQEQDVFLGMMQSCGICFKHRMESWVLGLEAEYIAPELLPNRSVVASQIDSQWQYPGESVQIMCEYAYDDPSLIRSIIAEIGSRARESAVYWRYGVCGYDTQSTSHFLIDYESQSITSSRITLQCKGHGSRVLASELSRLVNSIHDRHGMRDAKWSGDSLEPEFRIVDTRLTLRDSVSASVKRMGLSDPISGLQLGSAPNGLTTEHFVSYAWGDDSPDGKRRTEAIEELCQKAEEAGIKIIRDSTNVQPGDRISKFMDRLGESQRVFVILSDKYLKSEFCMYELWSIWRNCKYDPKKFLSHIRVFRLPCVQISKTSERLEYGGYWIKEKSKIDRLIETYSLSILGESDLKKYKCMADFAAQTCEILSLIQDQLQPKSFDELLARGFD